MLIFKLRRQVYEFLHSHLLVTLKYAALKSYLDWGRGTVAVKLEPLQALEADGEHKLFRYLKGVKEVLCDGANVVFSCVMT